MVLYVVFVLTMLIWKMAYVQNLPQLSQTAYNIQMITIVPNVKMGIHYLVVLVLLNQIVSN